MVSDYAVVFWEILIVRPMRGWGKGECDFCGKQVVKNLHLAVAPHGTSPSPHHAWEV